MQLKAFEAALRLIMPGPGDQPLMRVLQIAMDIADCPAGLIGVRRADRFQPIVSRGIPLASYRPDLPRSEALAKRLRVPCIIADAAHDPDFASHPLVDGDGGWRFIASVPLPFTILPFDVVLNCADPREGLKRRTDLLDRLEECAAIAADELRLIGDIAVQSEAIAEVATTAKLRQQGVLDAGVPAALVGAEGVIEVMNDRLRSLLGLQDAEPGVHRLDRLFAMDAAPVATRLDEVLSGSLTACSLTVRRSDERRLYQIDLVRVISTSAERPMALCAITDRTRTMVSADRIAEPAGESPQVVASFLLATLVTQKRLLRRGPVPYHALRRWRSAVKDTQVAALKALKGDLSLYAVDRIADELAAAARALFGEQTISAVVPVPCGNSGPACLSARLAEAVAERLALPVHHAFAPLPPAGGSHPKGNVRRARMDLIAPITTPVLLIDDVATSGAHLAEAALALKAAGTPAVLPLVWIADS